MRENRGWSPADVGTFMAQVRPSSCLTLRADAAFPAIQELGRDVQRTASAVDAPA